MTINTPKNVENTTIALASDFHFSNKFSTKVEDQVVGMIKNTCPDYACFPGDLVDIITEENVEIAKKFLNKISEIVSKRIIVVLGNHDITAEDDTLDARQETSYLINELKKVRNLILLENNNYVFDGISFAGLNAGIEYYGSKNEDGNILVSLMNKAFPVEFSDDTFNILLFHSPTSILKDEYMSQISLLKTIDLLLLGHIHRGAVPSVLAPFFGKNRGIIDPNRNFFPKYARGTVIKDGKVAVISEGVTVLPSRLGMISRFNCLYKPNVKEIKILSRNR